MKPIHWIFLAGLGYYLYSQKGKQTMTPLVALPGPITGDYMNVPGYTAHVSPAGDVTYTYEAPKNLPY